MIRKLAETWRCDTLMAFRMLFVIFAALSLLLTPSFIFAGTVPPTITWANPADIVYGTVLSAGSGQTLHVDFVPDDAADYSNTSKDVTVNVTPKPITVTADSGQSKVYGEADPTFTYTSDPLMGSDSFSGALSRDSGEDVGSYAITQGTLTAGSNYDITFDPAHFSITPKPITVTADDKSKTYGNANPALTYTITSGSLAFSDAFSGALTRDAGEGVGNYTITQGTLALSSNYNLSYVPGILTINVRSITVTADAQSKVYGQGDPPLTYKITSGSLAFTGAFSNH